MNIESNKIEGDFEITNELQLRGIITGNAHVKNGATLQLLGSVGKDVVVEKGGKAIIYGSVSGNVINNGGTVDILGMIHGNVNGKTTIDNKAVINGTVTP